MVADSDIDFHAHCYNGNVKLKRGGVNIPYTQEQVEEYLRCKDDIVHFVRNYVKIISLDRGLVLFDLYPFQEQMIRSFKNDRFSINLLARQMGKCCYYDTKIKIRNKTTGDVYEIEIGKFFDDLQAGRLLKSSEIKDAPAF